MRLQLAYVSPRDRLKAGPCQQLVEEFLVRSRRYLPTTLQVHRSETELFSAINGAGGRTKPFVVLLDSHGRLQTSEQFATLLGEQRDSGTQEMVLAVGPPGGWSPASRSRGNFAFSLGLITLPHELALAVLTEQTYRALTILAGHPYHNGHV